MIFNLNQLKEDSVFITQADEEFEGTALAESPFSVEVKRLKRAEKIDTMSSALDEEGNISNGEYSKTLFVKSIASVEGMVDENNQPITIEDGIREIIWEYGTDILVEKIKATIQGFTATEEKKSEQSEEDLNPTQNG